MKKLNHNFFLLPWIMKQNIVGEKLSLQDKWSGIDMISAKTDQTVEKMPPLTPKPKLPKKTDFQMYMYC